MADPLQDQAEGAVTPLLPTRPPLNRDGEWSTDELIVSLLPSLSALDEIAALETAYSTGDDRQAGLEVSVDATRVEALLRDLAGWATGVRSAYETLEDALRGD